ncbi:hypothetical protein MIND_00020900 [Mycena indigotica]|uniref:Uncharacterized protein n=1 Tax=Mycena indigotica TaxID=2126181 RepID=A0A8H6TE42_9AGAR|nr:uncharacterized protein MIND_00020900 [Mycena indigotica]KAF7315067.1 hypothetical protein MIND_00020900 [Mycena indigotica]
MTVVVHILTFGLLSICVLGQTWCNKNYMATEPITDPGGRFPTPATSSHPLLALRCAPAIRPYLPEDATHPTTTSPTEILVDTPIVFAQVNNAAPITLSKDALSVSVSVDGKQIAGGSVPLNATKHALPFALSALKPQTAAYTITCSATLGKQTFSATSLLTYLPDPPPNIGSVVKFDARTGAILARPLNGPSAAAFEPVFPIGFYTGFGNYLQTNYTTALPELKAQGFTVVHPIPSFDNITLLNQVLDLMEKEGLWLMYDMRGTYMNDTSVTEQVNRIKTRKNLLLWYTADEPDGTSDPLGATLHSANLINSLDGGDGVGGAGYHPVSLVLNCENYEYTAYASGADFILQDTYTIGNNLSFSTVWGTPCTDDYGDCGCDNCHAGFPDIATRMDEFKSRNFVNGWELTKAVWTVPQGFGNESYWPRYPTGEEWVLEAILGINHGGTGVISWDDPTMPDVKASASGLAKALSSDMAAYILSPEAIFRQITFPNGVDAALWTVASQTLVLATNINYKDETVTLSQLQLSGKIKQVFNSGSSVGSGGKVLKFGAVGSGGFVVTK